MTTTPRSAAGPRVLAGLAVGALAGLCVALLLGMVLRHSASDLENVARSLVPPGREVASLSVVEGLSIIPEDATVTVEIAGDNAAVDDEVDALARSQGWMPAGRDEAPGGVRATYRRDRLEAHLRAPDPAVLRDPVSITVQVAEPRGFAGSVGTLVLLVLGGAGVGALVGARRGAGGLGA